MIAAIKRLFRRKVGTRFQTIIKVLFWGLLGLGLVIYLAGFFVIPRLARAELKKQFGDAAELHSGRFAFPNRIRLNDVEIAQSESSSPGQPAFQAELIDITLNLKALLFGRMEMNSIVIDDFFVIADYNTVEKKWNLESILQNTATPLSNQILCKLDRGGIKIRQTTEAGFETIALFNIAGTIAANPKTRVYSYSLRSEGDSSFSGSELEGVLKLPDKTRSGQIAMAGKLLMPQARIFDNTCNLRDIQIDAAFNTDEIELSTFKCNMGSGRLSLSGGVDPKNKSFTDFHINIDNLSISEEFKPDTIVYGQAENLLGPDLWEFLQRFHPAGSGGMDITVNGSQAAPTGITVHGRIQADDIAMKDEKFPYLVEHLTGPMDLTGSDMKIGPLTCSHGDVDMVIEGTLTDFGSNAHLDLRTTSENMLLDDDLYRAILNPVEKRLWSWFTPTGITGINNRFQKLPNGEKKQSLELSLKDVGAVYKNFKYPLEKVAGKIIIEDECIQLTDVNTGYGDGREIVINGQVSNFKSDRPTFRIDIGADHVPVDERLMAAIPEARKAMFDNIHLIADGDFEIALFSSDSEPYFEYIVGADLNASHLIYDPFPLDLSDVRLKAEVTRKNIRVRSFEAATEQGRLAINGTVLPKGTNTKLPGFSLDLDLEQFDLSDEFWLAAGDTADQMLSKLRLSGPVNVTGKLVHNASSDVYGHTELTVDCDRNSVLWEKRLMGQATGRFLLEPNAARFDHFVLTGVSLDAIPPDLLGDKPCNLYEAAAPKGTMGVTIIDGSMLMASDGPQKIDASFQIDCNDVTVGFSELIHDLRGSVRGHCTINLPADQWSLDGAVDIANLRYRDFLVEHLKSDLSYEPDRMQLVANQIAADFYDGIIEGEFKVDLAPETTGRYTLGIGYEDIDLARVFNRAGETQVISNKGGTGSGLITLQGMLNSIADSQGTFTANIKNLTMGKQSLVGKILTAVQLKQPQDFVFSEIQIDATVKGPVLDCNRVRMVGDPLIFQGTGTFNIQETTMDMEFIAWDQKIGAEDSVLDMLARGLGSALWRIEMKGDINQPKVDSVFLSVLRQPLDFFKKEELPDTPPAP